MQSLNKLLPQLMFIWMASEQGESQRTFVDDNSDDPISKIIYHRTKMFNVKIPEEFGYLISACSNGNPGMAIIIYYTMLKWIVDSKGKLPRDGYTITTDDFGHIYSFVFPDIEQTGMSEMFKRFWNEQKDERGNNKVDTIEYWEQFFIPESEVQL